LAEETSVLLGNYNGTPTHTVSVLEGMKAEFPNATITYVPGTQFLSERGNPVPASLLTTPDGKPGLKADYSSRSSGEAKPASITSRVETSVNLNESSLPEQAKQAQDLAVEWSGFLNPNATGDYLVGVKANGFSRVSVDDKQVAQAFGDTSGFGEVHIEKGHPVKLHVTYARFGEGKPEAQLIWAPVSNVLDPAAVTAAKNADVVVAVVGITSRLEGEEMPVDQPGFLGGDRTNLDMPKPEEDLVQAVAATGKPLVVVLMNGSALSVNWEKAHANAIVEAWYAGEEGGAAI